MSDALPRPPRRRPWWLLGVAFVVVPLVEIWTIIQVGQVVGAWWTIGLLVLSGLVGSWLVKREGGRAVRAFRDALGAGRLPHRELADGILVLVGGTLMLTPGFLTDVLGILMILPLTRPVGRRVLARAIARRLLPGGRPGEPQAPRARRGPGPDDVVRGEVVDRGD